MRSLMVLLLCVWVWPTQAVELPANVPSINVAADIALLEDPTGRLTLDEVRSPAMAARFQQAKTVAGDLNLGVTGSAYWLRLTLSAAPAAAPDWLLAVLYGQINRLDVFVPGQPPVHTGSDLPLSSRPYFHRYFVFPLTLVPGGGSQVVYLRAQSIEALTVPVELWQPGAFNAWNQQLLLVHGIYFGALLALAAYNLMLWKTLRDPRFALCGVYSLLMGAAMGAGNGFGRLFVWTEAPRFDGVSQSVLLSAALAAAVGLTRSVLMDAPVHRRVRPLLAVLLLLNLGMSVLLLLMTESLDRHIRFVALIVSSQTTLVAMAWCSICAWRAGRRDLRFFVAAWLVLLVGGIVAALCAAGLVPTNVLTAHAVQVSTAVELVLLMMAMVDIVRAERIARERAQDAAALANEQALAAARLTEERLDQAVRQRTQALSASLRQLEEARAEQQQLLSLASHEFRTPTAVIKASVDSLQLLRTRLPDAVQERIDNIGVASRRLLRLGEQFIHQDRLSEGHLALRLLHIDLCDVLASAVEGLREASRQAPAVRYAAPQEPLPLDGDAPLLVVAVQNLLDNALRFNPAGGPPVALRAWREMSGVGPVACIEVRDHSPGVPDADKARVFERFFTSRRDMPGAGLGLSIVQRVVLAHQGSVTVADAPPQGAAFRIVLPLSLPPSGSR